MTVQDQLRRLPSIDELLQETVLRDLAPRFPRSLLRQLAREAVEQARVAIKAGITDDPGLPDRAALAEAVRQAAEARMRPNLRPLINATGVVLNTNLGRAPLSASALAAITTVASGYSNLEYELRTGERGSRYTHVRGIVREITGAESALVVNNCASAVLLVLSTLAAGREVIISRGQLVEIGGGFRVPDVMRQSGAKLVEVGTTNRTRLRDYEEAITEQTALLLSVHPSNFQINGFTESVALADLARLAHAHNLPLVEDQGSGCLLESAQFALAHEPTPQESIAAGVDIVCFSGDKLLGGPQAGLIIGREVFVTRIGRFPLTRAVRIDKLTIAALEATLRHYLLGEATSAIPIWRMISQPLEVLGKRAQLWHEGLAGYGIANELRPGLSTVGGGSLPGETLPTTLLALPGMGGAALDDADHTNDLIPRTRRSAAQVEEALRGFDPPVIVRIERDTVLLDPRTVLPEQDGDLLAAIQHAYT